MQDKATLRRVLRQWRRAITPSDRCLWDCAATLRLMRDPRYIAADTLLCTISVADELSTAVIIAHAILSGKRVAVPRWQDGTMEFCCFADYRDLVPDLMGMLQPPPTATVITDIGSALCVVPALAVTRSGYRLGYGGGYYDRFLASFAGVSVVLTYSQTLRDELPHESHDIAVGVIMTPDQTIETTPERNNYCEDTKTRGASPCRRP